jgi:transcriptional pleiotropic regulator of transition state genes
VIKKIDNLGRVVIPKGYRQMLGIKPGDQLDVEVDGSRLMIQPHTDGCTFCGAPGALSAYMEKSVCQECIEGLRATPEI